jgi:hypothetical protein
MEETKKEEKKNEIDLKIERQKFQMKKKGMEDIASSINSLAESLSPKEIGDGASFIVKGLKGDKGEKGDKGDKGETGIQGLKGDKGDSIKGEQGIPGKKGGQGLKGDKGENGLNGKDGKNGTDGKDGSPDSPDEIVSKLQGVKKQWLSIEAIDGDFNTKVKQVLAVGASGANGLPEAPIDGKQYARKDANWAEVIGGSGSGIVETVVAGTGISVDSTDPANPIVTNSAPDQVVSLTGAGTTTVTGTYPSFTITSTGGTGGGDVTGPTGAVEDNFASYDGITGKIIKDSGKKASDFMAAGSVTQYTDEMAQDAVGNAVGNGLDYDDATGAISVDTSELTLPFLKLDQSTPETIQGRPIFDDGLQLGLTPTIGTTSIGKMYWDVDFKTPAVELEDNVRLQVGQETMVYVYNGTGSTITQGKVVYTSGVQSGVPSVSLAQGDVDATSRVLGVVTSDSIATGEYGYVTIRGHVNNIDTSAWSVGDQVYLSADVAGALTNVKPNTGDYDTRVGRVMIDDASTGRVYVNIMIEYRAGVVSGGAGVDFFLDDATIYNTSANNTYPVKTLLKTPNTSAEDVDSIVCNNNTVLYGEYLWQTGLGDTTIQGGTWNFDIYAGVSSATNVSSITQNIYRSRPEAGTITIDNVVGTTARATASTGTPFAINKIDPSANIADASYLMITNNTTGLYPITARTSDTVVTITVPAGYTPAAASTFQVQKKLFGVSTPEINNTATAPLYAGLQLYTVTTVQPAYTILSTDQLGTKMFGVSTGARTIYFAHNGTTRYSHFTSPLITRHNDLAGLQGGAATEYYHLSAAQATIATQSATTDRSGYLTDTDWNIFNNKQNALTNPITGTGTANEIAYFPTTSTVGSLAVATYPSLTELSYVKGVTSAIQTQIGNQVPKSLYDANTILYATTDNTPVALTVGTNTVVGRVAGAIQAISSVSTATASTVMTRDANANTGISNVLEGYATTATAAGTTTLTVASKFDQYFTGSTTQTVVMPVVTTLTLGQAWWITNNSTGLVTVNSSGGNAIIVIAGGTSAIVTCIKVTADTTAAAWSVTYIGDTVASGKKLTVSNTLTLAGTDGTTMTFPSTSSTVVTTAQGNIAGTATNLSGTPDLPNGTTATTQSANDNSTKIATTAYVDAKPAGGFWTAVTGTRASNTTFTISGDVTAIFKKGLIVTWTDTTPHVGMVSIPSTYGAPNTTVTIIGDVCSASASAFKYGLVGAEAFAKQFASAGNLGAVATNIMNTFVAMEPYRVIGADVFVGTAGTTNATTFDINSGGTTMFTTKPTLATTVQYSPTPFTADDDKSLALGAVVTVDLDAIQTTNAQDGYIQLYILPTRYLYL